QLVCADIRERGETLAVLPRAVLRVAARVPVELPEERKLNANSADSPPGMPGAIARVAARQVGVDRHVAVPVRVEDDVSGRHFLLHLVQDRARASATRSSGSVDDVALVGRRRTDLAVRSSVLVARLRVVRAGEAGVEALDAGDLVARATRPTRPPEDRLHDR